jgi:hypothetical protein
MAKLVIEPKTARLFRDTETFGKMDPYVKFTCGSSSKKTKTHTNGGKQKENSTSSAVFIMVNLNFYFRQESFLD